MNKIFDKFRMLIWLLLGLALYAASHLIGAENPAWQTVAYKLGHVTTLAWFGYWISRMAVGRINHISDPGDRLSRAVIVAGVIIAGSLGL